MLFVVFTGASFISHASAETVQTAANVFNGRPYLWLEAENYASITDGGVAGNGWKAVNKATPINSNQGVPILPATSNVSGTALLDDVGGGGHEDTVLYQVKFITAGTYQLFTRHSMYDSDGNGTVGNEDSVYLSPAFNKNSGSDWVGFQGLDFDEFDISVDVPNPGFAADPDGWKPSTADSTNDGWFALRDWGVKSAGSVNLSQAVSSGLFNGHFNWYNRPFFVGANSGGGFASDFGFKTEYTVTPDMVGQTLTFEMGNREQYGVWDGFLFIQTSDIYPNSDLLDLYTQEQLDAGILPQPVAGDYNNNGKVDAADYVLWRNGGPLQNEVHNPGTVSIEDYNEWKARFGKPGSGSGVNAGVPEPTTLAMLMLGIAAIQMVRRREVR
jgi:PEP-CTERM motif-containing protein